MSTEHTYVRRLLTAIALAVAVLVAGSSAPTSAAGTRPVPVEVTASATEPSLPEAGAVRPGTTTFRVRNVDSEERWIGPACGPDSRRRRSWTGCGGPCTLRPRISSTAKLLVVNAMGRGSRRERHGGRT
ncbi:hypothetical protein [Embleya sp. MST-111070]|uniref:hypothetical protein n=1 Tax=Embleya sp. MST-111070 TaxID=3398231 RepID=UPI003F739D27